MTYGRMRESEPVCRFKPGIRVEQKPSHQSRTRRAASVGGLARVQTSRYFPEAALLRRGRTVPDAVTLPPHGVR